MKAVVFSGTTEGRQFSKILANLGVEVLVSVATVSYTHLTLPTN